MGEIIPYLQELLFNGSKQKRTIIVSCGLLLLLSIMRKRGSDIISARRIRKTLEKRKKDVSKAIQMFEKRYSDLTAQQEIIVNLTFEELRKRLQEGNLKALDALEAFVAKAVQVNRRTNAVTKFLEEAFEEARRLDLLPSTERAPLHGIPISLKEHIFLAGKDATLGIPGLINKPAQKDAELVKVLRSLGAVPFCRTNLPQTCISFDCSNPIFGITRNFHDPERSPGGSSGGEGALIAGGGSMVGIGSDSGGSVRMPAMFSGITSLKPTSGRLPLSGQGNDGGIEGFVGIYNSLGFMSKSVAAIEACMKEVLQPCVVRNISCDPRFVPIPWSEQTLMDKKLTIGWYDYDGVLEATPGVKRAVAIAINLLKEQGHTIVPFCPMHLDSIFELFGKFARADKGSYLINMLKNNPIDQQSFGLRHILMTMPWIAQRLFAMVMRFKSPMIAGRPCSYPESSKSSHLWELNALRVKLIEEILQNWEDRKIDVVIGPGMAMPALPLGYPGCMQYAISYTAEYNVLNFPVGSIPMSQETEDDQVDLEKDYPGYERDLFYGWIKEGTRGATGMSLNVQVIGRPWQEELVLRVMKELEDALSKKRE